jgi:hypothetical protein
MKRIALPPVVVLLLGAAIATAQTVQPPYDVSYTLTNHGSVAGLPTPYGGLDFLPSNSNTLVIGGAANTASGALYSIGVVRGVSNHITGFTGSAALFSAGEYNDGGVKFGPGGVLFYTRYPVNEVGEVHTDGDVDSDSLGRSSGCTDAVVPDARTVRSASGRRGVLDDRPE